MNKTFLITGATGSFGKFFLNLVTILFILPHSSFSLSVLAPGRVDSPPMSIIEAPPSIIDLICFFALASV